MRRPVWPTAQAGGWSIWWPGMVRPNCSPCSCHNQTYHPRNHQKRLLYKRKKIKNWDKNFGVIRWFSIEPISSMKFCKFQAYFDAFETLYLKTCLYLYLTKCKISILSWKYCVKSSISSCGLVSRLTRQDQSVEDSVQWSCVTHHMDSLFCLASVWTCSRMHVYIFHRTHVT